MGDAVGEGIDGDDAGEAVRAVLVVGLLPLGRGHFQVVAAVLDHAVGEDLALVAFELAANPGLVKPGEGDGAGAVADDGLEDHHPAARGAGLEVSYPSLHGGPVAGAEVADLGEVPAVLVAAGEVEEEVADGVETQLRVSGGHAVADAFQHREFDR